MINKKYSEGNPESIRDDILDSVLGKQKYIKRKELVEHYAKMEDKYTHLLALAKLDINHRNLLNSIDKVVERITDCDIVTNIIIQQEQCIERDEQEKLLPSRKLTEIVIPIIGEEISEDKLGFILGIIEKISNLLELESYIIHEEIEKTIDKYKEKK